MRMVLWTRVNLMICLFLVGMVLAGQAAFAGQGQERQAEGTFGNDRWIAAFYVAYWNRAADPGGLNYWMSMLSQGALDVRGVAENFAASDEAKALYAYFQNPSAATDDQRSAFVRAVYENLLNRTVSDQDEGVQYWVGVLRSGESTPGALIGNMIYAAIQANSADWLVIWHKVLAGEHFTQALQGRTWQPGYLEQARQALAGVGADPASVAAARARVDQFIGTLPEESDRSINGRWIRDDGLGIAISGGAGVFTSFSYNWQRMADAGFVALGDQKLKNIQQTSENKWSCDDLWNHMINNMPHSVSWSVPGSCSLTRNEAGNSILLYSSVIRPDGTPSQTAGSFNRQ